MLRRPILRLSNLCARNAINCGERNALANCTEKETSQIECKCRAIDCSPPRNLAGIIAMHEGGSPTYRTSRSFVRSLVSFDSHLKAAPLVMPTISLHFSPTCQVQFSQSIRSCVSRDRMINAGLESRMRFHFFLHNSRIVCTPLLGEPETEERGCCCST